MKKDLSIIIVNYNTPELVISCVNSIKTSGTKLNYEIIVVDNASSEKLPKSKDYLLIQNAENLGFAKANNKGIKMATGKHVLLLNSDTIVEENALDELYNFAEHNQDLGVVGAKLFNIDGTVQPSCYNLPSIKNAILEYWFHIKGKYEKFYPKGKKEVEVEAVVGAAFLITQKALRKIGGLSEEYFMYFEDLDYCRKVKSVGLKVYYLPSAHIVHYHGASGKKNFVETSQWKSLIPASITYNGFVKHSLINFVIWAGVKFSKFFPLLIIFFLITPTFYRLVRPGYFFMQDDLQAFRVFEMDKCFTDFQVPCRWVPDAGYSYGYPQFLYYPPSVYYAGEVLHKIGFQFIDSVKILFIAGLIFSSFAMYLLVADLIGKWEGFVSSLLYAYAPYKAVEVFVRGAMSEFWSLVLYPLIFWSSYKLIKTRKLKYVVILAILLASLFTTHLLMTLIFTPFFAVWVLYWLYEEKGKGFWKLFLSGFLGLCLAAFYVLPVLLERKYAHIESLTEGYFWYQQHFVNIYKLFFSTEWGYGSSGFPNEKLNLSLGIVQWIVGFLAVPILFFRKQLNRKNLLVPLLLTLTLFSIFMIHLKSSFIWTALPFMSILQFPWRFLTISIFLLSILGGYTIFWLGKYKYLFGVLVILVSIGLYAGFFIPKTWLNINDKDKFSGESWQKQLTISIFDYLPIYAKLPPIKEAPAFPEVLKGNVSFNSYFKGSDFQNGVLVAANESLLRAPIFDFPGMVVSVDGSRVEHWNNDCSGEVFCLGLVTFKIPQGKHTIKIQLTNTLDRNIGDWISFGSILIVGVLILKLKNEKTYS